MSEIDEVRDRLLERAVARLLAEGETEAEARLGGTRPGGAPALPHPALEELDGEPDE